MIRDDSSQVTLIVNDISVFEAFTDGPMAELIHICSEDHIHEAEAPH